MDDERIIALYWERDERALTETQAKYGRYFFSVSYQILQNREDATECENDTYLHAWNAMPPHRPQMLRVFLGKIVRNLSLKRLRAKCAVKRGQNEALVSLDELSECIPAARAFDDGLQAEELAEILNTFLRSLPPAERYVFICRYWYCDSIAAIGKQFGFGQSKVKMMLLRTRAKLAAHLEKEGVCI